MRIMAVTLTQYVTIGTDSSDYYAEDQGWDVWRAEDGGFWIKKGTACRWVGPTSVRDCKPHPDDVPQSPREQAASVEAKRRPKAVASSE